MEPDYREHWAPRYTYFVNWPNISILCSEYECLIILEVFFFWFTDWAKWSRGTCSSAKWWSYAWRGTSNSIEGTCSFILHQFPSSFKDPIYSVPDKVLNGQELAWIHLSFTLGPLKWTGHLFDLIRSWSRIFNLFGSTFMGTHVKTWTVKFLCNLCSESPEPHHIPLMKK